MSALRYHRRMHARHDGPASASAVNPAAAPGDVDATTRPLIDRETDDWVLSATTAPVVSLSPARRRLLATVAGERRTCILLTGESSALTPAYAEVANLVRARWVVAGEGRMRDARIGRRLRVAHDVLSSDAGFERAEEHARRPDGPLAVQLEISATFRHRNPAAAPFGGAIDALCAALAPDAVLEWGIAEPVNVPWEQPEVAEYVRERLEQGPWLIVSGECEDGAAIAATLRYRPTKFGAEEIVAFHLAIGPEGSDEAAARLREATSGLDAIATHGVPLFATVLGKVGRADLLVSPTVPGPAAPLGILIGAPGVGVLGEGERATARATGGRLVGAARRPSLVIPVGERIHPDNLTRLREAVTELGPEQLATVMGAEFVDGLIGRDWREEDTDA